MPSYEHDIPDEIRYLIPALDAVSELQWPTVENVEAWISAARKDPSRLAILSAACVELVLRGHVEHVRCWLGNRRQRFTRKWHLSRLMLVFSELASEGMDPFVRLPPARDIVRMHASEVPIALKAVVVLSQQIPVGPQDELGMRAMADTLSRQLRDECIAIGHLIDKDAWFNDQIALWLRKQRDTIEAERVHRLMYVIDYFMFWQTP